jgi:hypothetical protein
MAAERQLPLALGTGEAGQEIEGPMAVVILGGLITSTSLNLLILPTLALRYPKFRTSLCKSLQTGPLTFPDMPFHPPLDWVAVGPQG